MISRGRVIAGALVLCALAICAFAAASVSASELTAVTCKNEGGGTEGTNSHCETGTTGTYKTVALPLNTKTSVEGTSEEEPMLRTVLGGVNVTIKCTTAHVTNGWVENQEPSAAKHKILFGGSLTYTGCHAVSKAKETRFCAVEEVTGPNPGTIGMVSTNELEGETTGVEHKVKIKPGPGAGGIFAHFNVLPSGSAPGEEHECFYLANCNVEMSGSLEGEVNTTNHSHLTFTEANNGTELQNNGAPAKYLDTIGGHMAGEPETTVGATTFT